MSDYIAGIAKAPKVGDTFRVAEYVHSANQIHFLKRFRDGELKIAEPFYGPRHLASFRFTITDIAPRAVSVDVEICETVDITWRRVASIVVPRGLFRGENVGAVCNVLWREFVDGVIAQRMRPAA